MAKVKQYFTATEISAKINGVDGKGGIKQQAEKLQDDIQWIALSAMVIYRDSGNIMPMVELHNAMPKGVKSKKLLDWVLKFSKTAKLNADKKAAQVLVHTKDVPSKDGAIERFDEPDALIGKPWYEAPAIKKPSKTAAEKFAAFKADMADKLATLSSDEQKALNKAFELIESKLLSDLTKTILTDLGVDTTDVK